MADCPVCKSQLPEGLLMLDECKEFEGKKIVTCPHCKIALTIDAATLAVDTLPLYEAH